MVKIDWYRHFSDELGLCYTEQNEDYTDEELDEAIIEDKTLLEGILMELLVQINELESLEEENE